MVAAPTDSVQIEAYIRFRKGYADRGETEIRRRIESVEKRIRELQVLLGWEQFAALQSEQGLLFAWAAMVEQHQHDIDDLLCRPWLKGISIVEGNGPLRITARTAGRKNLVLEINYQAEPTIHIREPRSASDQTSRLLQAAMDALLAEGRLSEAVSLAAQWLGLELLPRPAGQNPPEKATFAGVYLRQRSSWLTAAVPDRNFDSARMEQISRELDALYHSLYVLDQQIQGLRAEGENEDLVLRRGQELEEIQTLPGVRALSINGESVDLFTETIYIGDVPIGQFRVTFNFASHQVYAVNTTTPANREGSRYDHPHIRDGQPCFGNIWDHVSKLMASRDLPNLVGLFLDFLRSYNSDNPYYSIDYWR